MQCVTPMFYVYPIGDKKAGKILRREEVLDVLKQNPNGLRDMESVGNAVIGHKKYIKVPCRKCYACRLNYSAEWATRIELECKKSEHNWFITLTYDDEHLPKNGSIEPKDLHRFINTLRKNYERKGITGIKYFAAGEYGPTTGRCHFHLILMHCPLDTSQFYSTKIDSNFKEHWKSHELEWYWSKPIEGKKDEREKIGFVDVAFEEWSDAAYVARYCMKKQLNKEYEAIGKYPERVWMSKGIGIDYYNDHKDQIYENDEIVMKTVKGNNGSYRPPKAFDRKREEEDPIGFEKIKKERIKKAEKNEKLKRTLHTYTDFQQLIQQAEKVATKQMLLPRDALD